MSLYREPHPLLIGGYVGPSYARALPWVHYDNDADETEDDYLEENPDFRYQGEDADKWQ